MTQGETSVLRRIGFAVLPLIFAIGATAHLRAQERVFQLDPAKSAVEFTLGDVLHTVHGTFELKSGVIRFDSSSGLASGELVVDATTGESGSKGRDKKMKRDILETDKFPMIVFAPQRVTGAVSPNGESQVQLQGTMALHGGSHPMTLTVPVKVDGDTATADVHFIIPYVQWGLKNPSTLFLRVSNKVDITVHAVGTVTQSVAASGRP
jgi:polyisoprenoid-binding protein YceI